MRDFRKLIAWQKAHALAVNVHRVASESDLHSTPGLRSQLLRAVDSVPANIAEGAGKESESEFARFLEIALGSAREVDNHLTLATALGCIDSRRSDTTLSDVDEVKRILYRWLVWCGCVRMRVSEPGIRLRLLRPRPQATGTQGGVAFADRCPDATPPCSPVFWGRDLNT